MVHLKLVPPLNFWRLVGLKSPVAMYISGVIAVFDAWLASSLSWLCIFQVLLLLTCSWLHGEARDSYALLNYMSAAVALVNVHTNGSCEQRMELYEGEKQNVDAQKRRHQKGRIDEICSLIEIQLWNVLDSKMETVVVTLDSTTCFCFSLPSSQ